MLKKIFKRFRKTPAADAAAIASAKDRIPERDPLDPVERTSGWTVTGDPRPELQLRSIDDFPIVEQQDEPRIVKTLSGARIAMDSGVAAKPVNFAMDAGTGGDCNPSMAGTMQTPYAVPEQLMNWYMSQSFIGYQACALIAQHWLVDKACAMSGEDAVRNGWTLKAVSEDEELDDATRDLITRHDEKFQLVHNLKQLSRFKNIFGIRVALFEVESDDDKYYEKPFNIDGVTEGSYKGISQVDPYWMMPMLTSESTADPSSMHFYDPEFWIISGKKYHRSHLVIIRAPEPADILKPTYIFGGVPLTQRIYERVYAAERIANEAPLLATNKRTTAIHVDTEKAILNEGKFIEKLKFWVKYRDNHAIKVLGKEETMEQFDTSLADFDAVIMNQYQLAAAIAEVPATKLLGTAPKGFNATGEFETISYHEKLESVQKHEMSPMLERHYLLTEKSLGLDIQLQHVWEPVDSMTALQRSDLNLKKAQTGKELVAAGAISPDEERNRIRDDKYSGYNRLSVDDAEGQPGMSPEALAELEKSKAQESKATAEVEKAGAEEAKANATVTKVEHETGKTPAGAAQEGIEVPASVAALPPDGSLQSQAQRQENTMLDPESALANATPGYAGIDPTLAAILGKLTDAIDKIGDVIRPEGLDIANGTVPGRQRTTLPGIKGSVSPGVTGAHQVAAPMEAWKLPKIKVHGMNLVIENPRGSNRRGQTIDGETWSVNMPHHYGFIKGVNGYDGDELDCFVGPNLKADQVFVVNQNDASGEFDEHKCMLGFDCIDDARAAYDASYGPDWKGFDSIVQMTIDQFKEWAASDKAVEGKCESPLDKDCIAEVGSSPQMADNPAAK